MPTKKSPYPVPGLTKAQREVFEQVASGNYTLACVFKPKAVAKLLGIGAIVQDGEEIVCRDRFGTVKVPSYHVPLGLHMEWCFWCSEQPKVKGEVL